MSGVPVIVRCDGGAAIGLGHVTRCLALADALRDEHGAQVTFAMRDAASAGVAAVRARGYAIATIDAAADADYGPALAAAAGAVEARAIVVDVRDALARPSLEAIRASGVVVVSVDDASDRRLAADLAFYPPAPQVDELDWHDFDGRRFAGWDWVLLTREFAPPASAGTSGVAEASAAVDVLITMGGSDPAGLTAFSLDALNRLPMPLAVQVVVGPAFARHVELGQALARSTHAVRVAHAPPSMAPLMRASRVAVAAFGMSAYELAACGVPAVHLALTPDHARSSSAFDREGIAITAGVFGAMPPRAVADATAALIGDAGRRLRIAARARALVDGRGASRIAQVVMDSV